MDNYSVSEIVKIICTLSGLKKKSWAAPRNGAGLCVPSPSTHEIHRASGSPLLSLAEVHSI